MSQQGGRIAFTAYRTTASIWKIENGSEKLLVSGQSSNSTPQLSPDGRFLVYRSDCTGSFELWISRLDGQNGIRLTDFRGPMVNNPRWSPDGTWIVFEMQAKFINRPADVVEEMLESIEILNAGVCRLPGHKVLIRSDIERIRDHQVTTISGGGSGHEPAHAGYVGAGMLSAAVVGGIFTSPDSDSIFAAIRAAPESGTG